MTSEIKKFAVSSMNSILASIENDRQVYRWFLMLVCLPEARNMLCVQHIIKEKYQTLKKVQIGEIITYLVMASILSVSCFLKQPWDLLAESIPLMALGSLYLNNRRCVAAISEQFLLKNLEPDKLNHQTLYQTSEYFSKKYNIPSLVDIITFQDRTARIVLLASILFIPFIYPFKTWQIYAVTFAVVSTTLAIADSSPILRRLK